MMRLTQNRKLPPDPLATLLFSKKARMSNWRDDEIRKLLSVRAEAEVVRQIQGTARDSVVYDRITNRLRDLGVFRSKSQVNSKLKALKRQYHQIVDHNGPSVKDRGTWCYFNSCEAIWGANQSTNPVALVESMETASTSGSPETPCASSRPETPHSDAEQQPLVYADERLFNDSFLSTEASCHSPPKKKKRRPQTHSERLSAEMRGLFAEMDKEFDERERLRLSEQREYEEQIRREAREEKAQEMAVLRELTSLLKHMVQRMPAAQRRSSTFGDVWPRGLHV